MEITVDKNIVAKAIFESIGPDQREQLLQNAVEKLLEVNPHTSTYGRTEKTFIQEVFEECAIKVAREVVKEEMAKPEVRKKFNDLISAATLKALDPDSDLWGSTVDRMATAMLEAMTERKGY